MKQLQLIQSELKAPKNQTNAFGKYKYRSCEDILEAVKPLLLKHECTLTISDIIKEAQGLIYVEATCTIKDKSLNAETVTAQAGIDQHRKGMDIAQSFGSSSSYARKYALNGLFLIDDTKDGDTNEHAKQVAEMANDVEPVDPPKKVLPFLKPTDKKWNDALEKETPLATVLQYFQITELNKTEYTKQLNAKL